MLNSVRARWVQASYLGQPEARCGHSAVAVVSATWGEEFLVRGLFLLGCCLIYCHLVSMRS